MTTYPNSNTVLAPSYRSPPKLTTLAAHTVTRCLVYEDPEECNFYRWDPVKIWQFEAPQKKKKGKKKNDILEAIGDPMYNHPLPPWRELMVFRSWWWTSSFLGALDSSLRSYIVSSLEQLSWTSSSAEEDVLFLLLQLIIDTQINIGADSVLEIPFEWSGDLILILEQLAPFPLQKLTVTKDIFGIKNILSTIIQGSPRLRIIRIGQWDLSNDILATLGINCNKLQEFSIPSMKHHVFMSDTGLFQCFFSGMTTDKVISCHAMNEQPKISFPNLKFVDILFCKQMQMFMRMLNYYYPNVCISGIDATVNNECYNLVKSFLDVGDSLNLISISIRTKNILDNELSDLVRSAPFLRELRIHVDNKFPGADHESMCRQKLEEASIKLKNVFGTRKSLESLVVRPHDGTDATVVVLPAIATYGEYLKSLHLIYDYSNVNLNTLYQLVNQCPYLSRLIIILDFKAMDKSSKSFRTKLQQCPYLDTLVLVDLVTQIGESNNYNERNLAMIKIARNVLEVSPNLQSLGLSYRHSLFRIYYELQSISVTKLHLHTCREYDGIEDDEQLYDDYADSIVSRHFLKNFVPNFPNLQVLSLEDSDNFIWTNGLNELSKKGFRVTKKRPEFFNIFKWNNRDTESINNPMDWYY